HPFDTAFATAIDMCHALALRYDEAGRGENGIGSAASLARQMGWQAGSACDRLMAALLKAAPQAVRFAGKKGEVTAADRYPEFRAWHAMYKPIFRREVEEWREPPERTDLFTQSANEEEDPDEEEETGGDE
ncbi:MAG: hypothetical protein HUU17_03845, partial [Chthonomonadales bacterium]|nr:hypothetical protein [Chthonomonadales bacterium]